MINLINKILRILFSERKIWEIKNKHNIPSMEWSLQNIKRLGFECSFAVDAGAHDGEWTVMFKKIFPSAHVLMIEALQEKEPVLKSLTQKLADTYYHIGLLGAVNDHKVTFYINSTVSSILKEHQPNTFSEQHRKLETIDTVIEKNEFHHVDFIKLDVQGYEIEILKGGAKILDSAKFILCEVSLIDINQGCPLLADVIAFLKEKGFIAYDICSFIRRPLDKALWQTDILFIRQDLAFVQNKHWA